jgi:hypothetical protein
MKNLNVCIIGGGHAAHTLMALLPSRAITTRVFTSFNDEAERINQGIKEQGYIRAEFASHNEPSGEVRGLPVKVSNNPEEVIPQSNVILIPLPSFAYFDVLKRISKYISPGTFIGATPGQGGFDYIARHVLGDKMNDTNLFSIMPMPFNCRISEFGKSVKVQQYENEYIVCASPQTQNEKTLEIVSQLFGKECVQGGHFLTSTLCPLNANIHPQRMYTLLKNWSAGKFLPRNPYFYEEMDSETGVLMDQTSMEIQKVVSYLTNKFKVELNVPTIFDSEYVSFPDPACKTIDQLFAKSPAYKGFKCPLKQVENGWVPDFSNRYFIEDIPYGLCVWKGIAELAKIETPIIDMLINWAQKNMGKEYLVNNKLVGKDIIETSAPQRFGYTSIQQFI